MQLNALGICIVGNVMTQTVDACNAENATQCNEGKDNLQTIAWPGKTCKALNASKRNGNVSL